MKTLTANSVSLSDPVSALEDVRLALRVLLDDCPWPELKTQIEAHLINAPLPTIAVLPLAACAAVGSNPRKAAVAASASLLLAISTRWLDDLSDRDREHALWTKIGASRTMTLAAGALTLAWQQLAVNTEVPRQLLERFGAATLKLGAGQDRDLMSNEISVEQSWEILRGKTAVGFAFMLESGGWMAEATQQECNILYRCGEHIGVTIQLLDDLDGVLSPDGIGDLATQKHSNLLLVHGLNGLHRQRVRQLLKHEEVETLRDFLVEIGSARAVLAAALQEKELALKALNELPSHSSAAASLGRERIANFIIGVFSNLPKQIALA